MELKQDNQIVAKPRCKKCGIEAGTGIAMLMYYTEIVCGECAIKISQIETQQRQKWLQEIKI